MTNSLTSTLSDLTLIECETGAMNGNSDLLGSHVESDKQNPWKARLAKPTENKLLEADAWPEPSAPLDRKTFNPKIEEKSKNKKVKWLDVDIESPAFQNVRGRSRFSGVTASNQSTYQGPQSMPMRNARGTRYNRGRISEVNRSRPVNGHYQKQSSISYQRHNHEDRTGKSNDTNVRGLTESTNTLYESKEPSPKHCIPMSEDSERSFVNSTHKSQTTGNQLKIDDALDHTDVLNSQIQNKNYVCSSVGDITNNNRPARYTESAYSRPRRSNARGHLFSYSGAQKASLSTQRMSMPPITPIAYLVPSVIPGCIGNTLLAPAIPITQSALSTDAVLVDSNSFPTVLLSSRPVPTPTPNPPLVTFSEENVQSLTVTTDRSSEILGGNSLPTEVVSLEQMLHFISEVGWQKTKIPECLANNPSVLEAQSLTNLNELQKKNAFIDNREIYSPVPDSLKSSEHEKPIKREDVVIVDDTYFFVPRNVHQTKFLKFQSKLDYIRHHVEYYFSDANLHRDIHLVKIFSENDQTCPLSNLLQFNRLRWANVSQAQLLEAVLTSPFVTVVYSKSNQPVGVAPNTAVSIGRPHNTFSIVNKNAILEPVSSTTPIINISNFEVGAENKSPPPAGTDIAEQTSTTPSTSNDLNTNPEINNCFLEPVYLPVFANGQLSSQYIDFPMLMQSQRIPAPNASQQINQNQPYFSLQSSQGYILPSTYTYPSNQNQPQGIPAMQFSPQLPYYVHPVNGSGDPSSVVAAQAVAAAVAAQQQQAVAFSNPQQLYATSQSPTIHLTGNSQSDNTTSPSLVPAFYRLAMPQPSLLHQPTYGPYASNQPGINSTNPVLLHFLPNIPTAYMPTTQNSNLAALVGRNTSTTINNSGGIFVPFGSSVINTNQLPFHLNSPAVSSSASNAYTQKYSSRSHHNHQRSVNLQYPTTNNKHNNGSVDINIDPDKKNVIPSDEVFRNVTP